MSHSHPSLFVICYRNEKSMNQSHRPCGVFLVLFIVNRRFDTSKLIKTQNRTDPSFFTTKCWSLFAPTLGLRRCMYYSSLLSLCLLTISSQSLVDFMFLYYM